MAWTTQYASMSSSTTARSSTPRSGASDAGPAGTSCWLPAGRPSCSSVCASSATRRSRSTAGSCSRSRSASRPSSHRGARPDEGAAHRRPGRRRLRPARPRPPCRAASGHRHPRAGAPPPRSVDRSRGRARRVGPRLRPDPRPAALPERPAHRGRSLVHRDVGQHAPGGAARRRAGGRLDQGARRQARRGRHLPRSRAPFAPAHPSRALDPCGRRRRACDHQGRREQPDRELERPGRRAHRPRAQPHPEARLRARPSRAPGRGGPVHGPALPAAAALRAATDLAQPMSVTRLVVAVLVLASLAAGGTTFSAFSKTTSDANDRLQSARIFPRDRTVVAQTVSDASGPASNKTNPTAYADSLVLTTSAPATTFAGNRYLDIDLAGYVPDGLTSSAVSAEIDFGDNNIDTKKSCMYFETRRASTGAVLDTSGSAAAPLACNSGAIPIPVTQTLTAVTSAAIANDLRLRIYFDNEGANAVRISRVVVRFVAYGHTWTLRPTAGIDSLDSTPAVLAWGPAKADGTAWQNATIWPASFSATKYVTFGFPDSVPGSAVVSA